MDISSYSLKEAKEYIRNLARMRMNAITFHSYNGQWHPYRKDGQRVPAGHFFYGQRHSLPSRPETAAAIQNRRAFCIPKAEAVLDEPDKREQFAVYWLNEVMNTAKEVGMKVTLSIECQESTPLEAEKEMVTEALRLYPQIDVIELITPEGLRRLRLWENRFRCSVEHLKAISELEQFARFAMKEYCNPLDIPYKFQHYRGFAHREAADPTVVYSQDISSHGWERNNKWENFEDKYKMFPNTPESYSRTEWKASYLEGAYLTKWNGKYYLQFAAPGTELSCYGDGCCTADHPLGPYRFQPNTPFSLKPSGFITGAGHGSTIADEYGKKAAASSSREGHAPELALNEDIRSWWSAEGGAGEWYRLDLGKIYAPHSVQLNFAEEEIPRIASHPDLEKYGRYIDDGKKLRTRYRIDCSNDGETWELLVDASFTEEDRSHPYHILPAGTRFRYLRVAAAELPYGSRFALSGLRVFGLDDGEKPKAVPECRVKELDPMTAVLNWEPAEGAVGYNVRYGIAPEKLYTSYLLYEKNELLLTGLNAGQEYFVCVDSFNESGVTEGAVQKLR